MSDPDDPPDHPVLGQLKHDERHGWLGANRRHADQHDLYIMRPEGDDADAPPDAALVRLSDAVTNIDALKADAVAAICAARTARLGWRAGPDLSEWSLVEARIDVGSQLWLSLHEYVTDEYSLWLVRAEGPKDGWIVRRRPWVPYIGAPGDAGDLV